LSGIKATPNKQKDQAPNGCADQACALTGAIQPGKIADARSKHCSCHTNDGGDDETLRRIRTRHQKPPDDASNESNDNDPEKNTHLDPLPNQPLERPE